MPLPEEERRKVARAIWAYTGKTQPAFEKELGWEPRKINAMTRDPRKSAPSTDELLVMAEAAGVPTAFCVEGWAVADPVRQLQEKVSRLSVGLAEATAEAAQHRRMLQEILERDRRTGD